MVRKICDKCMGNGYRRIWKDQYEKEKITIQCAKCNQQERQMKNLVMMIMVLALTSCSEVLLISSIGGTVVSQSPAIKAYNGVDALTIMKTKKDIKKHVYDKLKGENDR